MSNRARAGQSREEVIEADPLANWNEAWGQGFVKPDACVGYLYKSLKAGKR